MANRVTMTICGTEYTLVAEEDAAYMEKVGEMVDSEMRQLMDAAHMSRDNAAVLAAQILAVADPALDEKIRAARAKMQAGVEEAAAEIEAKYGC